MPGRPYVILSHDLKDPFFFLGATGRARTCQVVALVDDHSRFFSRG